MQTQRTPPAEADAVTRTEEALKWPGPVRVRDMLAFYGCSRVLSQLSRNKNYNVRLTVAWHRVSIRGRKILSQRICD